MSYKKGRKSKNELLAKLVTENKVPCAFCQRKVDDEVVYGKLYAIGDLQCHYFCVLLSCCLIQKGKDEDGLFGFLYADILTEIERSKKHRCSYCGRGGATLGCSISQCRKQFHLPCGRERSAMSLFYGNYKSYCQLHAPKQDIPNHIMVVAKLRMKQAKTGKLQTPKNLSNLKELCGDGQKSDVTIKAEKESVCVICYEEVDGFPTLQTFWPPCCARDAWFHRSCLQRMALSAGMHYLKCPLCNDKENFYEAVVSQGYYVPDRDAAWELEQNAFAEIYERQLSCGADECHCPMGRNHDSETGLWDIKLCLLCGTGGVHSHCLGAAPTRYVCQACAPAAPVDLDLLATSIEAVVLSEQSQGGVRSRSGPVMPSRMSLRRTKRRVNYAPSTSRATVKSDVTGTKTDTHSSRMQLNLKSPKRVNHDNLQKPDTTLRNIENTLLSPMKLLEQGLNEKVRRIGMRETEIEANAVIDRVREKFKKPRPLSEKKRIVNNILDDLFDNLFNDKPKTKEHVKEWSSPKKCFDITNEVKDSQENATAAAEPLRPNYTIEPKTEPVDLSHIKDTDEFDNTDHKTTESSDIIVTNAIAVENNEPKSETLEAVNTDDESTTSTFQLHPEFIADHISDDDLVFDTPKLKTVDIQKDSSLEISENDEVVNINVVKMEDNPTENFIKGLKLDFPVAKKKCALKFSAVDKEALDSSNLDIDMESFQNHYLNEVDRDFQCKYGHSHKHLQKDNSPSKFRTALDFALDAYKKENLKPEPRKLKRKKFPKNVVARKKRKGNDSKCVLKYKKSDAKIKLVCSKDENRKNINETIDVTVQTPTSGSKVKRTKKKKHRKVTRQNIQVKIKWKEEQFRLKITKSRKKPMKRNKIGTKNLKQYVLKYPSKEVSSLKDVIAKPESDVTPIKRKYEKQEKSPDNLVQTSIQSFFKIRLPVPEKAVHNDL